MILVVSIQLGRVETPLPGSSNYSAYAFYLPKPEQYKKKCRTGKPVFFATFYITNVSYSLLKAMSKNKSQEAFVLYTHRKMRGRFRVRTNCYRYCCYCCCRHYYFTIIIINITNVPNVQNKIS